MLTLTAASKETKLIIKWAAIILAVIFVILIGIRTLIILKETLFPTPPPKPTVLFGKLTPAIFPGSTTNENFTYSLDTISGELPNFPQQLKIYKVEVPKADLLALKNVGETVANAGFQNGPFKVSDKLYFWTNDRGDFLKTIRVNIQNGNFTLFSPFYFDNSILAAKNLPREKEAIKDAQNFLSDIEYLSSDLDLGKTKANLLSIKDGQVDGAISLSSAHGYRVNFFQKNINNLPVYYEKPNESNVNVIITGGENSSQVVRASYLLQKPSKDVSTYPMKTSQEAFEELKDGKAYIASFYGESNKIKINEVFLAYYISSKEQEYILPIIVFVGNDGFYAYVSAVTDEWISK